MVSLSAADNKETRSETSHRPGLGHLVSDLSPDWRVLLARCSPVLLACCSLPRRRFSELLSGLTGMSVALETFPTGRNNHFQSLLSSTWSLLCSTHLLLGSGCSVTVACSASALTSLVGNVRPSPWLRHAKT